MTGGPVPAGPRRTTPSAPEHSPLARWAVGLAVGGATVVTSAVLLLALAGEGLGVLLTLGTATSLVAFVLGVVATRRHERWPMLMVSLVVFPLVVALLVLGELLWWE